MTRRGGNRHWQNRTGIGQCRIGLSQSDTDQHAIIKTAGSTILVGENTLDADIMDAANQIRAMKRIEPHIQKPIIFTEKPQPCLARGDLVK